MMLLLHLKQCSRYNVRIDGGKNRGGVGRNRNAVHMLEYAVWLPATVRFVLPIALDGVACFFDDHMPFGTISLKALALAPFGTNAFVAFSYANRETIADLSHTATVYFNRTSNITVYINKINIPNAAGSCRYGQLVPC